MEKLLYKQMPESTAKLVNLQPLGSKKAEAFVKAFLKRSMPQKRQEDIEKRLNRKVLVLKHPCQRKTKHRVNRQRGLSAKQRREMHLFEIPPEQQRYEIFIPLHELWKQYIRELCNGLKPDAQPQMIQTKLLKADFHGALVTVIPKWNNIFSIEMDGFVSYIYGSRIQFRASERSAKKFKGQGTMDL
ncbi:ribonuclease P protein subunit p29 isoform X2 [Crotalus tigris]|uniref:ribonuclease P protein subunit p29 isoform X2 n=1 Tax=Crotalus tigris TaxID=88082 RepID=UPI00192F803A|nr:ribonuclease P protein subunit p29 isoform X2 [Crotalus tigris]